MGRSVNNSRIPTLFLCEGEGAKMRQSKKTLESRIAKSGAAKAEKAIAIQSDLEWWSVLLECFYGPGPTESRTKEHPLQFPP
jgi:hypothetical protein